MKHNFEVKVLLISEGERWVAQCLEYDFAAQGKTMSKAMDCFSKSFAGQIYIDIDNGKEPLEDFTAAPVEYWDVFNKAADRLKELKPFKLPERFAPSGIGFAQRAIYA